MYNNKKTLITNMNCSEILKKQLLVRLKILNEKGV